MRIVKLKGGLGNQMFQYAFAKLLEQTTGEEVVLDYSAYGSLKNDLVRVPRIKKFDLSLREATKKEIKEVCFFSHTSDSQSVIYRSKVYLEKTLNKRYYWEPDRAYRSIQDLQNYLYYDGYWQSWRYVKEVKEKLIADFKPNYDLSLNTRNMMSQMSTEDAIFVGVRRGDYLKEITHYGSFSSDYYLRAMHLVAEHCNKPVFYVFSNDIEWCKENISWKGYDVRFRFPELQTNDFEELLLMASCKHAIIVNSSYNWWGAELISNPEKIICCPHRWWFDDKPIDIIPDEWRKMKGVL